MSKTKANRSSKSATQAPTEPAWTDNCRNNARVVIPEVYRPQNNFCQIHHDKSLRVAGSVQGNIALYARKKTPGSVTCTIPHRDLKIFLDWLATQEMGKYWHHDGIMWKFCEER